jgi:hypothetical protein
MFLDLHGCPAAVADISLPNPNVFYELGVRHALMRTRTILLRNADAAPMSEHGDAPFDLAHLRYIAYRLDSDAEIEKAAAKLTAFLTQPLAKGEFDSPVFESLPRLEVGRRQRVLMREQPRRFHLKQDPERSIGVIPGNLDRAPSVDVWVNSENTQFEMARFAEQSISSVIRTLGSTKTQRDGVTVYGDEIYQDLKAAKRQKFGDKTYVPEGCAILARPRELAHPPYHVKMVAHVASVTGEAIRGFSPVKDLGACITGVLQAIGAHNALTVPRKRFLRPARPERPDLPVLESVVFPLLGTGQAREDPVVVIGPLVSATVAYLKSGGDPCLKTVHLLARTDVHMDLLLDVLTKQRDLEETRPTS